MERAFRDAAIASVGTVIPRILPPVFGFDKGGSHAAREKTVLERLVVFFDRYFGLT